MEIKDILDRCVLCGACKALCPTYKEETEEPLSARGRLTLLAGLQDGELEPSFTLNEKIFSCLMCGMCETACPSGVGIMEALYMGRHALSKADSKRKSMRRASGFMFAHPGLCFKTALMLKPLMPYLLRKSGVPFKVSLPPEPLKSGLQVLKPKRPKGRVAVYAGCAVNYLYPELGESLIAVLIMSGYEVVLPAGEACCGAPLRAMGLHKEAVKAMEKNMDSFSKLNAEAVISLCPTCTLTLKKQYKHVGGASIDNAMDASEFLDKRLEMKPQEKRIKAYYHVPCHLRHGLGHQYTLKLLDAIGFDAEPSEDGLCCGFSLSMTHREISDGMLQRLRQAIGAHDTVVSSCPGCIAQLRRIHPNVIHLIEAVEEAASGKDDL